MNSEQSNRLPRAICALCEREVAVRRGGELREHVNQLAGGGKCAGSGYTPARVAAAVRAADRDHMTKRTRERLGLSDAA